MSETASRVQAPVAFCGSVRIRDGGWAIESTPRRFGGHDLVVMFTDVL